MRTESIERVTESHSDKDTVPHIHIQGRETEYEEEHPVREKETENPVRENQRMRMRIDLGLEFL